MAKYAPRLEALEDRLTPAVTLQLDYRYDTGYFTGHADRQAAVQAAANVLQSHLFDSLAAITPSGGNVWSADFSNPSTGAATSVQNMTVPADTIIVYLGGTSATLGGLARGGTGAYEVAGDRAWLDTVGGRGQAGALAAAPTDFGPWGGTVTYEVNHAWSAAIGSAPPGQLSLYQISLHELEHVLGFGTTGSFFTRVSGSSFIGPASVAVYGGPVPLDASGGAAGHWAEAVTDHGATPVMIPVNSGPQYTALDLAALSDIGWQVSSPTPPAGPASKHAFAVGAGQGSVPHVKVYNADGGERFSFYAYDLGYVGGVRVATADVNGDGYDDIITGTTPGTANGHVKVFDGLSGTLIRSFYSMPGVTNGIFVAGGDTNGDGHAEIIVGADAGIDGGEILVYDGVTNELLTDFRAFTSFLGGVRVAAGDVTGDGRADIIAGSGFGSTPHVKVFSGTDFSLARSFFAYDSAFRGGVYVAAGDFDGDGVADIVTSAGDIAHVKVIEGALSGVVQATGEIAESSLRSSFIATGPGDAGLRGGSVAALDRTGDGRAEILLELAGTPSSQLRTIDPTTYAVLDTIFAFPGYQGDLYLG